MPINGAYYWYTAALAPPKWSRFLSFLTGWTNVLAMFTSTTSFVYAVAGLIIHGIVLVAPEWIPTNPQVLGVAYATLIVWAFLATLKLEQVMWVYISCCKSLCPP